MRHTASVRVKSGLPLIATVSIFHGDGGPFVEIEELCWPSGKPIPQSLFDSVTDMDSQRIIEQVEDDYFAHEP